MSAFFKKAVMQAAFLFLGSIAGHAEAAVWTDNNQWNQQWEDRFSDWVKNEFNEEIFTSGKYKDIPTDCADAVYLSRVIFAFENKLPFSMLDSTGGKNRISNRMSRFDDSSSEMSRFRQFASYISDMGDTKTLPNDTYPVAISREYVRSGAVWSRPRIAKSNIWSWLFGGTIKEDPGHAEVVKNVTETGAIELIGSTVPSAVRKLISTSSLVFMPVETSTGLRKWMEPEWYGRADSELPGHSMEQFQIGKSYTTSSNGSQSDEKNGPRRLSDWQQEVQAKLQLRAENKEEALFRMGANLCNLVQARVATILKSEKRRSDLSGKCMDADDYDSYSTPSRDKRIMTTIEEMVYLDASFGFTVRGRIDKVAKYMANCPQIQITSSRSQPLLEVARSYAKGEISSNPNDSFEARWGLAKAENGANCPKY
jgi:hypothetical protein